MGEWKECVASVPSVGLFNTETLQWKCAYCNAKGKVHRSADDVVFPSTAVYRHLTQKCRRASRQMRTDLKILSIHRNTLNKCIEKREAIIKKHKERRAKTVRERRAQQVRAVEEFFVFYCKHVWPQLEYHTEKIENELS